MVTKEDSFFCLFFHYLLAYLLVGNSGVAGKKYICIVFMLFSSLFKIQSRKETARLRGIIVRGSGSHYYVWFIEVNYRNDSFLHCKWAPIKLHEMGLINQDCPQKCP
jgi:hypothetical protein